MSPTPHPNLQTHVVYSPDYDIHYMGMEKLHPFDSRKYSRAWNEAHARLGHILERQTAEPGKPVSRDDLLLVHTPEYLEALESPDYVLRALEIPTLPIPAPLLGGVLRRHVLRPMALATAGTVKAAELALLSGSAINLSGGYHHAGPDRGEGFCIYADVALAVRSLQTRRYLTADRRVLVIDLDAHQGNGLERVFLGDPDVSIFDMYNADIYPGDTYAAQAIAYPVELHSGTADDEYLDRLRDALPRFLDSTPDPALAFYNAGTDVYESDLLGNLRVSAEGVMARDKLVFDALTDRGIPWVMVLSGGYSAESYHLIANSIEYALTRTTPSTS